MKKKILIALAALVVLLAVAVTLVVVNIDGAVKRGVETFGPQVTQVTVTLDSARISILGGSGSINGLVVGNPAGYKADSAIKVGKATLAVAPGSLLKEKIVVRSINIEAPEINFEGGLRGSNLSKILENVQAYAGTGTAPSGTNAPASSKRLQVDEFVISGAIIKVSLADLGGRGATVTLPEIRLTNLGANGPGLLPGELVQIVMKEVLQNATKVALNSIGDITRGLTDAAKGSFDAAKDVTKGASDTVQKATKSIGNLFKKN